MADEASAIHAFRCRSPASEGSAQPPIGISKSLGVAQNISLSRAAPAVYLDRHPCPTHAKRVWALPFLTVLAPIQAQLPRAQPAIQSPDRQDTPGGLVGVPLAARARDRAGRRQRLCRAGTPGHVG